MNMCICKCLVVHMCGCLSGYLSVSLVEYVLVTV